MTEPVSETQPIVCPRGYQDPLETWSTKFIRKFNENPLVPIGKSPKLIFIYYKFILKYNIGCLLTCGALIMSAHKLRQGKSKEMNTWLRARVALQGVTIVALVVGSLQLKKARDAEKGLAEATAAAESERQKQEFENRLKEAERATVEEAELARALVKGKSNVGVGERTGKGSYWWPWSTGSSSDSETKA